MTIPGRSVTFCAFCRLAGASRNSSPAGPSTLPPESRRLPRIVSLGLASFAVWLLWSNHYTPLLLACGAGSCLLVVLLAQRMKVLDEEGFPVHLGARLLTYVPWLAWALVRSNVDVALRILRPKPPISPRLLRVRPGQRTSLGRAIYANSITLTPGTLTCDADGEEFTIHALTGEAAEELESGAMDRRVRRLEGGED